MQSSREMGKKRKGEGREEVRWRGGEGREVRRRERRGDEWRGERKGKEGK